MREVKRTKKTKKNKRSERERYRKRQSERKRKRDLERRRERACVPTTTTTAQCFPSPATTSTGSVDGSKARSERTTATVSVTGSSPTLCKAASQYSPRERPRSERSKHTATTTATTGAPPAIRYTVTYRKSHAMEPGSTRHPSLTRLSWPANRSRTNSQRTGHNSGGTPIASSSLCRATTRHQHNEPCAAESGYSRDAVATAEYCHPASCGDTTSRRESTTTTATATDVPCYSHDNRSA